MPTTERHKNPPRPLPLFWRLFEGVFQRFYRMEPLVKEDPGCLLAFNFVTYRGPDVPLRCGTVVRPGDLTLELHFRREALAPLMSDGDPARMGLGLIRLGDRDIPRLAQALEREPRFREVRALHALTLFHRGVARWGFEVMPVQEARVERWFTWWHRLLMARDHAHGEAHVRENRGKLVTKHVWVSREELIRRYEGGAPRPAPSEACPQPADPSR